MGSRAHALGQQSVESYAYAPEWLNLLYFERSGQGFKSLVTSRAFFIADDGNHNPLAELKASLKLLGDKNESPGMSPQCAYPARYEILKRHFKLADPVPCPQLHTWLTSYEPTGIELVYTSPFISNPASVFGHAFLLVPSNNQVEALWYTFNFAAAIPSDVNPFAYAWGGLTGWYNGDFANLPFYQRLFQYSAIENRDLWRYPISLSKAELQTVLKHFWELVHLTRFRYYFLDQNCASYILRSLAAVLPDLSDKLDGGIYAHPVDVIKILKKNRRFGEPIRVSSSFENLRSRFDQLSAEEKSEFFDIIELRRKITPQIKLDVLECVVDYLSLERVKHDGELPEHLQVLEREAFIGRSRMMPRSAEKEIASNTPPHASHESMRASLGLGHKNDVESIDLGYRFAIHDLLEDDAGFLPYSTVEILSGRLSASRMEDENEDKVKIGLKDLSILKLENYPTYYRFDPKGAWRIHLGGHESLFESVSMRYQSFVDGAYGGAMSLGRGLAFTMVSAELFSNGPQSPFYTGLEAGYLLDTDFVHIAARVNLSTDPFGRGKNPKLAARIEMGLPINARNAVQLKAERECLYKNPLCRLDFGAEWRRYF